MKRIGRRVVVEPDPEAKAESRGDDNGTTEVVPFPKPLLGNWWELTTDDDRLTL